MIFDATTIPFDAGSDACLEWLRCYAKERGDERLAAMACEALAADESPEGRHKRWLALGEIDDIHAHARAVWESSNP